MKIDQKENISNTMITYFMPPTQEQRKKIVSQINKLIPRRDKLSPSMKLKFDKKKGFVRIYNKVQNTKFVKVHNEIRELRKKIHSYPDVKLRVDKKGEIHQIFRKKRKK